MGTNQINGINWLAEQGLNLFACFDTVQLPSYIQQILAPLGVEDGRFSRLILLGHGGRTLWQKAQTAWEAPDPIDQYSLNIAKQFLQQFGSNEPHNFVYPLTDIALPLTQLGVLAGWHHPSPLGIGINGTFGVWFAYRVAFLTTDFFPPTDPQQAPSPCESCADKPCIAACPAGAVGERGRFQANACFSHRLANNSSCADRCLSRLACPYFPEHRYSAEQVGYHYGLSLNTLKKWVSFDDQTGTS